PPRHTRDVPFGLADLLDRQRQVAVPIDGIPGQVEMGVEEQHKNQLSRFGCHVEPLRKSANRIVAVRGRVYKISILPRFPLRAWAIDATGADRTLGLTPQNRSEEHTSELQSRVDLV